MIKLDNDYENNPLLIVIITWLNNGTNTNNNVYTRKSLMDKIAQFYYYIRKLNKIEVVKFKISIFMFNSLVLIERKREREKTNE